MFRFLKSLFTRAQAPAPRWPVEDREASFKKVRTLPIGSGSLIIDSGGNDPHAVFVEPGKWSVFQSRDEASCISSVALVRPQLATAGRLIDRDESSVMVDDGCVTFVDSDVYDSERGQALLRSDDRLEARRWPRGFFLSSTGIGDGNFRISVLATEENEFDRLGMMAVIVSFTATPSERVLRSLAATLPAWKEEPPEEEETPSNGFHRDLIGRYQLTLADRADFLDALNQRRPWTIGDLQILHEPSPSLRREQFTVIVSVTAELAATIHRSVAEASRGTTLEWQEFPDFSIRLL